MVDGEIDPRSVDAMEKFKNYSKEAQQNMQSLQQQMDKFTNSMSMTKMHTKDLTESLRNIGNRTRSPSNRWKSPSKKSKADLSKR
jgi:hypothetical protein